MRINLNFNKTLEENAGIYFDKAKKAKRKIEGVNEALALYQKKLAELEKKEASALLKEEELRKKTLEKAPLEWFEKFRWFISSEGFLVIGGRDATTNEIVVKKHADKDDLIFHTDMAGSPFFVLKASSVPGKKPSEITVQETANATACYSRAWGLGLITLDVFHVNPDQVTKETPSGEYMGKGSFMIKGKTTYVSPIQMKVAIGIRSDGKIIGGPVNAVLAHATKYRIVVQGKEKPSDLAKKLRAYFGSGDLDDIIRVLPSGGCEFGS